MKMISLSRGLFALIDDEDYERVSKRKWRAKPCRNTFYAETGMHDKRYRNQQFMHNFIAKCPNGLKWDHKDGDGLNNQKSNLRPATHSQNLANAGKRSHNTSGYKGVTFRKERKTWRAQIRLKGKLRIVGCFRNKLDAAKAYDAAARELFGEFAQTNF